jgi:hypothetical protein
MLVNCPECGRSVSDRAPSCPGCGLPGPAAEWPRKPEVEKLPPSLEQPIFGTIGPGRRRGWILKGITILALLACSPVGVLLVWFVNSWSMRTRAILCGLGVLWFLARLAWSQRVPQ